MGQIKSKLGEANLGVLSIRLKAVDDKWSKIKIEFDERLSRLKCMLKNNEERISLIAAADDDELDHLAKVKEVSREMHDTTKEFIRIVRSDFQKIAEQNRVKEQLECIDAASNSEIDELLCERRENDKH